MPNDVYIIPFQPSDIIGFIPANKEQFNAVASIPEYFNNLQKLCSGNALSIWKKNTILAITGWMPNVITNCAYMFFIPSIDLKKYFNKNVLRAFRNILDFVSKNYVRVEADCEKNNTFTRFLDFLGFQKEGVMRCASFDHQDLLLYSIVNPDLVEEKYG